MSQEREPVDANGSSKSPVQLPPPPNPGRPSLGEHRGRQHEGGSRETMMVEFEEPHDPDNPLQWPAHQKWINVFLISAQGTLTPIASTLPAVAAPAIAADLHTTSAVVPTLPVALFVLGLGLGPLYLAPLSEACGRRWVYLISFGAFAFINIGCALAPGAASLSVLRLLSAMAGSAGPSLGGASIGDMFSRKERGKAQALYGMGPTGGPVIGGVISGFILHGTGSWRWLMWLTVIGPGVTTVLCGLFLRETYAPVILRQREMRRRKKRGERMLDPADGSAAALGKKMLVGLTRPLRLLVTSPICASMAIYAAIVYAILYLHLLSLGLLFGEKSQFGLFTYGWAHGATGLSFLGAGVGIIAGTFISAKFSDPAYAWMEARQRTQDGERHDFEGAGDVGRQPGSPESRVLMMQIGMFSTPIGLAIFAWTAARVHWAVPLLGAAIFATGMIISYIAFQTYLVDAFGRFAASALATATILRSILGCVFSVVGFELYKSLGYAWGTMLLALLCASMTPLPLLLYFFGPRLRAMEFRF